MAQYHGRSQDHEIIRPTRSGHVLSSVPAYRAKNTSAGRATAAPAAGSSSLNSSPSGLANLKPEPVDKQAKGTQPVLKGAVHETFGNGIPNADHSNGKPTPCFAVAEILVQVDCSPSGPQ
jgi:hypothetical protein